MVEKKNGKLLEYYNRVECKICIDISFHFVTFIKTFQLSGKMPSLKKAYFCLHRQNFANKKSLISFWQNNFNKLHLVLASILNSLQQIKYSKMRSNVSYEKSRELGFLFLLICAIIFFYQTVEMQWASIINLKQLM